MPVRDFGGEEPPQTLVWLSAVQHVGVVSVYLTFELIVMREGGASASDTMAVLALSFVAMGWRLYSSRIGVSAVDCCARSAALPFMSDLLLSLTIVAGFPWYSA